MRNTIERPEAMAARRAAATPARPAWLDPLLYPFTSRYLELDGHTIHYIDEGRGPTLLFLHANPLWSFQYRALIRGLADRFRCVAIDYPGFGLSTAAPGHQMTLTGSSRLVEQVIQALGLSEITLVAHDVSVSIGLGVVVRQPAWFRAVVISNSFAWPLQETPSIYRFIRVVSSAPFRFLIVNFNFLIDYTVTNMRGGLLPEAARRAYRGPFDDRARRHHQHDLFRSLISSVDYLQDLQARLRELPALPALLLFADNDPTYRAGWLARFEEIFPRHRSVLVHGADHFPHEHAPEAMVAAIGAWWTREVETPPSAGTMMN